MNHAPPNKLTCDPGVEQGGEIPPLFLHYTMRRGFRPSGGDSGQAAADRCGPWPCDRGGASLSVAPIRPARPRAFGPSTVDLWAASRANPAHRVHRRKILPRQNLLVGKFCAENVWAMNLTGTGAGVSRRRKRLLDTTENRRVTLAAAFHSQAKTAIPPKISRNPARIRHCTDGAGLCWHTDCKTSFLGPFFINVRFFFA